MSPCSCSPTIPTSRVHGRTRNHTPPVGSCSAGTDYPHWALSPIPLSVLERYDRRNQAEGRALRVDVSGAHSPDRQPLFEWVLLMSYWTTLCHIALPKVWVGCNARDREYTRRVLLQVGDSMSPCGDPQLTSSTTQDDPSPLSCLF